MIGRWVPIGRWALWIVKIAFCQFAAIFFAVQAVHKIDTGHPILAGIGLSFSAICSLGVVKGLRGIPKLTRQDSRCNAKGWKKKREPPDRCRGVQGHEGPHFY